MQLSPGVNKLGKLGQALVIAQLWGTLDATRSTLRAVGALADGATHVDSTLGLALAAKAPMHTSTSLVCIGAHSDWFHRTMLAVFFDSFLEANMHQSVLLDPRRHVQGDVVDAALGRLDSELLLVPAQAQRHADVVIIGEADAYILGSNLTWMCNPALVGSSLATRLYNEGFHGIVCLLVENSYFSTSHSVTGLENPRLRHTIDLVISKRTPYAERASMLREALCIKREAMFERLCHFRYDMLHATNTAAGLLQAGGVGEACKLINTLADTASAAGVPPVVALCCPPPETAQQCLLTLVAISARSQEVLKLAAEAVGKSKLPELPPDLAIIQMAGLVFEVAARA